jgi:nucleoside 2-deoxyribosyltransferase
MPFSKSHNGEKELLKRDLDYIYKEMIKKSVEEFDIDGKKYFHEVSRYEEQVGSIIKGIVQKIKDADLVIADLTGLNPNVMYELGVRHSLKRGTIMLTQNFNDFPSDLRDYMTVVYKYSDNIHEQPQNFENFKRDLHGNIQQLINSSKTDSPVLDYVDKKDFFHNEQEVRALKESVILLNSLFEDFDDIKKLINDIETSPGVDEDVARELMNFHLNCLNNKLLSLRIPFTSEMLYEDLINVSAVVTEIMKKFTLGNSFLMFVDNTEPFMDKFKVQSVLCEEMIDPIHLKEENKVKYCQIKNIFNDDGFLYELLDDIEEFINSEATRLGVEKEIEDMFAE